MTMPTDEALKHNCPSVRKRRAWPLWPRPSGDATYLKVRRGERIVSLAVIIAVG